MFHDSRDNVEESFFSWNGQIYTILVNDQESRNNTFWNCVYPREFTSLAYQTPIYICSSAREKFDETKTIRENKVFLALTQCGKAGRAVILRTYEVWRKRQPCR